MKVKQPSVNLTQSLFAKPSFGHNETDTILLYEVSDGWPLETSTGLRGASLLTQQ
jgi:hypothetical protein